MMKTKNKKQIIAIGGGGYSVWSHNLPINEYILRQSGKKNPRICFLGTASGDSTKNIQMFYEGFGRFKCRVSHLSLYKPHTQEIEKFILSKDIIYVGGGNTLNLLVLWHGWKLDKMLRKAWEKGIVLAGASAGSICWFEEAVTDSIPGRLRPLKCLGFLPGSNCPHYDSEKKRRPAFHRFLAEKKIKGGYAVDDCVALHFIGSSLENVIASKPNAHAYVVGLKNGRVVENKMVPTLLPGVKKMTFKSPGRKSEPITSLSSVGYSRLSISGRSG